MRRKIATRRMELTSGSLKELCRLLGKSFVNQFWIATTNGPTKSDALGYNSLRPGSTTSFQNFSSLSLALTSCGTWAKGCCAADAADPCLRRHQLFHAVASPSALVGDDPRGRAQAPCRIGGNPCAGLCLAGDDLPATAGRGAHRSGAGRAFACRT